jgi:hypothetical protein
VSATISTDKDGEVAWEAGGFVGAVAGAIVGVTAAQDASTMQLINLKRSFI